MSKKTERKAKRDWRAGKPKKPKQANAGALVSDTTQPSRFERWAEHITQILTAESKLVGSLVNHPTLLGDAREALVKGVLERILPSAYEIGTGQVIDAHGNESNQMDIIIARRDFPVLRMPSGYAQYPVEGVIATIEVKSELDSKTLSLALDNCYSIAKLRPDVERHTLQPLLDVFGGEERNVVLSEDDQIRWELAPGEWEQVPPPFQQRVETAIFPETFIYGYSGYKKHVDDFHNAIVSWLMEKTQKRQFLKLVHLPTLIVGEKFIAMRNQVGFAWILTPVLGP